MVNTFLTSKNYSKSARRLDISRLRKQCIEAKQILNILEQILHIVDLEGWEPQPDKYIPRIHWIKQIRRKYLDLDYRYVYQNNRIVKVNVSSLPYKIDRSTGRFTVNSDGTVTVWSKRPLSLHTLSTPDFSSYDMSEGKRLYHRKPFLFKRENVALPTDTIYTLGFSQHAAVKMWVGYEDSLREYINAHIKEYCSRKTFSGKQCSICIPLCKYSKSKYPHPWWLHYKDIILSHRASLLRKEQTRNEDAWYIKQKVFTRLPKEWLHRGYIWPGSLDEDIIERMMSGEYIDVKITSSPISADARPLKTQEYLRQKYNYTGIYKLDQNGYVKITFKLSKEVKRK